MLKVNKILLGVAVAIAAIYAGISLFQSIVSAYDVGKYCFYVFNPLELINGTGFMDSYYDISELFKDRWEQILTIPDFYFELLDDYIDRNYSVIMFMAIGFVLVLIGMVTGPSVEFKGKGEDTQQYLFTSRPNPFVRCIAMPWNIFASAWRKKKAPVIIPILFIPFILPNAILCDIVLIVVFVIEKAAMSVKTRSAYKADKKQYDKNVGFCICPKCKRKYYQPKVKCKCGVVMDYPVPGVHGISSQICAKGHVMPCTNEGGARGKLNTVCPYCGETIQTHEAKPIVMSMIGAAGAGKTTLMVSAVESMVAVTKNQAIVTDIATHGISADIQRIKDIIPPTVKGELESECMFIRSREILEKELIFNDISGSEFEPSDDRMIFQEYYKYSDGLIFVIDPMSVMAMYNSSSPIKSTKSTSISTFESFYNIYAMITGVGPAVKLDVPFAVVLSKMDNGRVSSAVNAEGSPENFLSKYGQDDFVKVVGSTFENVRYFAVSSLGKEPNSMEPFKWIIDQCDEDLKTKLA